MGLRLVAAYNGSQAVIDGRKGGSGIAFPIAVSNGTGSSVLTNVKSVLRIVFGIKSVATKGI